MKKVLLIGAFVIAALLIGAFILFRLFLGSMDQVKLQYDEEVISNLKRELDFSPFEEARNAVDFKRLSQIGELIESQDFSDVQAYIKEGRLTCEEIVVYYLNKIEKYDQNYNSIIQLNPQVIEEARALDKRIKDGEDVGKLFGAVITVKDNIAEKNMNTAAGAYALRNLTTSRDAFVVQQLKDNDAIVLGKCNLSEWSNYMSLPSSSGFSTLGGQTKNAYGKFDVGGSSSGSSVAASLNFSTVTLGTETAGSLVFPAGQNSVVAIKPTVGILSRDLIIPISEAQDTAGIIGRSVEDVYTFFTLAIANDANDPEGMHAKEVLAEMDDQPLNKDYLKGKRVGILKDNSERYTQLKNELEEAGAKVVDININEADLKIDMTPVLEYGIVEDVNQFLNHPDVQSEFKSLKDILAFNMEAPDNRMPFGAFYHEAALNADHNEDDINTLIQHNRTAGLGALHKVMEENKLIAIASFSNELSGVYAPAICPAVTVPAGYQDTGEPYGVTFVSTLNKDLELMRVAFAYEQYTNHRVEPKIK